MENKSVIPFPWKVQARVIKYKIKKKGKPWNMNLVHNTVHLFKD